MPLIGGRRRRTSPQDLEGGPPPAWVVRWFLFGEPPEKGGPGWREYIYGRFFGSVPLGYLGLDEIFRRHKAALEAIWKEQGPRGEKPYYLRQAGGSDAA